MFQAETFLRRDLAILKVNVSNRAVRQAMNDADLSHVARYVDDLYIPHHWQNLGRGRDGRNHAPLQVEFERLPRLMQFHVPIGGVLHHAAAARLRLEADRSQFPESETQFRTSTFRMPPDVSLPIATPP
jgi:hypothetical protein